MNLTVCHHRNRLEDFLRLPAWVSRENDFFDNLTSAQQTLLTDILPLYEDCLQKILVHKKELLETGLFEPMWLGLAPMLYYWLLSKGHDPKDETELLDLFRKLKAEQIREILAYRLKTTADPHRLLSKIEESDRSPELKWYWYQAIQYPEVLKGRLVSVLEKVFAIYGPYYDQVESEILATEEDSEFLNWVDVEDAGELGQQNYHLIILAPWHMESYDEVTPGCSQVRLVRGSRTRQFLSSQSELDIDRLALLLKTMGDSSRYRVLLSLLQPNARNKDIAKEVGITTASVSFHTQKLLNSGLIQLDRGQSYHLNMDLLSQFIKKIEDDLGMRR